MSQLSKSLEKRIQELTTSIESQKTELAAYERVLHMETSKEDAPAESVSVTPEVAMAVSTYKKAGKKAAKKAAKKAVKKSAKKVAAPAAPAGKVSEVAFTGNKTTLVAEIVKSYGSAGATPKDVDAFFTSKDIARSKNLIYNTLSYLVAQKKLRRVDGKYFVLGGGAATSKKTAAPAAKKVAAKGTKRRLSPEGLKRIKEALKKRWADKRAAEAAAKK